MAVSGVMGSSRWENFKTPCMSNTIELHIPQLIDIIDIMVHESEKPINVLHMYYKLPNNLRLEQDILVQLRVAVCELIEQEEQLERMQQFSMQQEIMHVLSDDTVGHKYINDLIVNKSKDPAIVYIPFEKTDPEISIYHIIKLIIGTLIIMFIIHKSK
jgi:hypothetical protein